MRIEPNADLRQMAILFYQMKVSFTLAGFTDRGAFELTRSALVAQLKANTETSKDDE